MLAIPFAEHTECSEKVCELAENVE